MTLDPATESAKLRAAIRSLEALDWRRDMLDESSRWWFAYSCPKDVLAFLSERRGRLISGPWVYYLPKTPQAYFKGTVRKISFDDWQLTPASRQTQLSLGEFDS